MPWLYFVLALGCFAIAGRVQSMGLALICLLAAFGLILWGTLTLAAARIQSRSQSASALNPAIERQRLKREREGDATAATYSGGSDGSSRRSPDKDTDSDTTAGDSGGGDGGGGD